MGLEQTTKMCRQCNRHVVAFRPGANHLVLLLMTLLTAGLWLIIWFMSAVRIGGWRCSQCGAKV